MLTIHRNYICFFSACRFHDKFSAGYQCFFVSQRNFFTCLNGRQCRLQSGYTCHRYKNRIDIISCYDFCKSLFSTKNVSLAVIYFSEPFSCFFIGNHNGIGLKFHSLFFEHFYISFSSNYRCMKTLRMCSYYIQSLFSDRTCTSEYCYFFHFYSII